MCIAITLISKMPPFVCIVMKFLKNNQKLPSYNFDRNKKIK